MKKTIIVLSVLFAFVCTAFSQTDGDKADSTYKKAKIKNRAAVQAERGIDDIAGKKYIYADDDKIDAAIAEQKGNSKFSIGSVELKKGTHLKEINILVKGKGKKQIVVDQKGLKPAEVNIGHVSEEQGASVEKVKSIIEMEVEVKSKN